MRKSKRIPRSTPNRKERMDVAFEQYFAMGSTRSLEKLALQLDVGVRTINEWSTEGQWQRRVDERLQKIAAETERRVIREAGAWQADAALKMMRVLQRDLTRWENGELKLEDPRGVEVFAKLVRLFLEKPTENVESKTTVRGNLQVDDPEKQNDGASLFDMAIVCGPEIDRKLSDVYVAMVNLERDHPDVLRILRKYTFMQIQMQFDYQTSETIKTICTRFVAGGYSSLLAVATELGPKAVKAFEEVWQSLPRAE